MPGPEYHLDFAHKSKTMINHFIDSRAEYHAYYVDRKLDPPAPKRVMEIGSAIHAVLLEKLDMDKVVAVYDEYCFKRDGKTRELINSLNPKAAEEFRDIHHGRHCLKPADAQLVFDVCESVRASALGPLLAEPSAVFETPIYWTCPFSGLLCRCCPDFYHDMGDYILAYDLKVTELPRPKDWQRVADRMRYWLQEAHYSTGLSTHFGKPVVFKFWVIEAGPLCRISRRVLDPASRAMAQEAYQLHMQDLASCYRTGNWTDKWTQEEEVFSVNPWNITTSADLEFDDDDN